MAPCSIKSLPYGDLAQGREGQRLGFWASVCLLKYQVEVILNPHLPILHSPNPHHNLLNQGSTRALRPLNPTPPGSQIRLGERLLSFPQSRTPPSTISSVCLPSFLSHLCPGGWGQKQAALAQQLWPCSSLAEQPAAWSPGRLPDALPVRAAQATGPTARVPFVEWSVGDQNASGALLPSRHLETPILLAQLLPRLLSLRSLETRREGPLPLQPRPRARPPSWRQDPRSCPSLSPPRHRPRTPGPPPGSLKRLFFVQFRFVSRLGSRSCHFLWFSQPLSSSTSSAPRFPFCAPEATLLRPNSPASFACVPRRPLGSPPSVSSLTPPSSQVCSLLLRGRPARSDLPVFSQPAPGTSGDLGGGHAAPPPQCSPFTPCSSLTPWLPRPSPGSNAHRLCNLGGRRPALSGRAWGQTRRGAVNLQAGRSTSFLLLQLVLNG